MKIDFLTLWVDDQSHFIEALAMDLETWLDAQGFKLEVLIHTNANGVLTDIKNNDVELIIIDYRLGRQTGDTLIEEIRQNDCFQDIIFYSEGELPNLRFDGVHFVSKEDAKTRIKELIKLKLKRSLDLATLRGWIVADAIELENMLNEILLQCFSPKNSLFEIQLLTRGYLDFFKKQTIVNSILSNELKRLNEAKDTSERHQKLKTCKEILKSFEVEVIHYRNAVAHGKVDVSPDGIKRVKTLVKNPEYFNFDEISLVQGRKNIRKQRDNLVVLRELMVVPSE
jgi:CheY-like chemotaxis protein